MTNLKAAESIEDTLPDEIIIPDLELDPNTRKTVALTRGTLESLERQFPQIRKKSPKAFSNLVKHIILVLLTSSITIGTIWIMDEFRPREKYIGKKFKSEAVVIEKAKRSLDEAKKQVEAEKLALEKAKQEQATLLQSLEKENKRIESERRALEKAKQEEEKARKLAEQQAREAEARRLALEKAKQEETRLLAEQQAKEAEARRLALEKSKKEEVRLLAEKLAREAEAKRLALEEERKQKEAQEKAELAALIKAKEGMKNLEKARHEQIAQRQKELEEKQKGEAAKKQKSQKSSPADYQAKATLLLKIASGVKWPRTDFATSTSPIQVCVYGVNPFGSSLDKTFAGKKGVHNRRFLVKTLPFGTSQSQLIQCRILFAMAGPSKALQTRNIQNLLAARTIIVSDGTGEGVLDLSKEGSRIYSRPGKLYQRRGH